MMTATHATIPIAKIALHPRNPRRAVGNVDDLAASILEVGILEDLIVAPWPKGLDTRKPRGAEYVLIAGHRRLTGAKQANLTEVPVKIRADLDTLPAQLKAALVENLHRSDLTPVEEADTYQELLDLEGLTQTALAKQVGQPVTRVRERLKLAKLASPVKEKVHAGQITITDAIAVESFAEDKQTHKELLKVVGTSNFNYALTRAEQERKRALELEKRLQPYRDAGVTIRDDIPYDLPKGWKSAATIMTGGQTGYVQSADAAKWDAKDHADCPGRTVLVQYGDLKFACSEGRLHPVTKPAKSKAELKREAAEREARETYRTSCDAATAVRRRHIVDGLSAAAADHTFRAKQLLAGQCLDLGRYAGDKDRLQRLVEVEALLGLDFSGYEDLASRREQLGARLHDRFTLEGLVFLADLMSNWWESEQTLAKTPRDGVFWHGYKTSEWIRELDEAYGYQWSDWERQNFQVDKALAPEPAAAADPPAAAAGTEDGDD